MDASVCVKTRVPTPIAFPTINARKKNKRWKNFCARSEGSEAVLRRGQDITTAVTFILPKYQVIVQICLKINGSGEIKK
jgi:hypothetical protein